MPDGVASAEADATAGLSAPASAAVAAPSPAFSGAAHAQAEPPLPPAPTKAVKDPRKIARNYQLELCKKAMEENIIVYLGTGCGKTHIAVLLIYEMLHLMRKPEKNICVFVAPTVALVQQQARVLEESLDVEVRVYCGRSKCLKSHDEWAKEIEEHEVLVMTPQILFRNLSHCFIKIEWISLLIFDECHHAQVQSSHPYAEIMKVFYQNVNGKLPRIFGMTASPIIGKGACSSGDLTKNINSLEALLNAKVYSFEDKVELESFVTTAATKIYDFGPVVHSESSSYVSYYNKLEEISHQCLSTISQKTDDHDSLRSAKRQLRRMHSNIIFCLESLGLCALQQASQAHVWSGDLCEYDEIPVVDNDLNGDSVCKRYLVQAAEVFSRDRKKVGIFSNLSCVEILKEPFFSRKLLRLIGILSSFRLQPNMKCIVFVNRVLTARSLSYVLQRLKFLAYWKCDFLVGVHSGRRSMSRKNMNIILEKFRSGELNLLVATKVGEEGLDIQTCCLVIRFDLPETVSSFIQSRGRARMPKSEYAFLINSANRKEMDLIEKFQQAEDQMNMEITFRTSNEALSSYEQGIYKVESSGASSSSAYSVSLLHQYCSKLPHDEFFHPKPQFFYFDDLGGRVCHIILPSNAPIYKVVGSPQASIEAAKKDACLKAIRELHNVGALSDHLLPSQDDENEQGIEFVSSDSGICEDADLRGELHEMVIPAALKEPWTSSEDYASFHFYYIKFKPLPADRTYKKFGIFVKSSLPDEVLKMELDLHLARRRSVITKFVSVGISEFNRNEIVLAEKFQEMFLKVILDRSEFISDYVPLVNDNSFNSGLRTFYLLLPLIMGDYENALSVDWGTIKRCLTSPIFRHPAVPVDKENKSSVAQLHLADGCRSITDIKNSLMYTTHNKVFYFITDVVQGKNGYSPFKDSENLSYMQHLIDRFDIHLRFPEQPLLRGKSLFSLRNLLHNRKTEDLESFELEEHFIDLPPELCQLKIIGFSKDIGSSLSLLPSVVHRLENLLVAIELRQRLSASFPEGFDVTADRVLEALTTKKCQERFSLERLEILGDAFLKFAVGRHLFLLHGTLDEGELTRRRSNAVNNSSLFMLGTKKNLQAYIRNQPFDPCQFFAFGRPCQNFCSKETQDVVHGSSRLRDDARNVDIRCTQNHDFLSRKTIADVIEALIGAFLVDSGFKAASAFLQWIGITVDYEASQLTNVCSASLDYIPLSNCINVPDLEVSLGYQFLHRGLLLQAFVHPSYSKHGGGCYQRLEFLGDAILDYLITSYLYTAYPKLNPGHLTDLRSAYVNNRAFANIAVDRSFHKFLICDSNKLSEAIKEYVDFITTARGRCSIEGPKCPKALGDLVESSVGAILLDTGFDLNRVWSVMLSFLDPVMRFSRLQLSPTRELLEVCQSHNWDLQYTSRKKGNVFVVEAMIKGKNVSETASATNANKKEALKIAARHLSTVVKARGYQPRSKALEDILRSCPKAEAKLIGCDEEPVNIIYSQALGFENSRVKEPSNKNLEAKIFPISELLNSSHYVSASIRPPSSCADIIRESRDAIRHHCHGNNYQLSGRGTARSHLYEICAANFWKPPLFECCSEEGPSHLKSFRFKVVVEIDEGPAVVLECYGAPRSKKKDAAEHAAEGLIWYLKQEAKYLV